jgi:hypothetical protein
MAQPMCCPSLRHEVIPEIVHNLMVECVFPRREGPCSDVGPTRRISTSGRLIAQELHHSSAVTASAAACTFCQIWGETNLDLLGSYNQFAQFIMSFFKNLFKQVS